MSRIVSFVLLVAVIIVVGIVFYRVMADFIIPLFLAALLVVIFRPMHAKILERVRGKRRTAALLTTIAVMFCVLVPFVVVLVFAAAEGRELVKRFDGPSMMQNIANVRKNLGLEIPYGDELHEVENSISTLVDQSVRLTDSEFASAHKQLVRQARQLGKDLKLDWPEKVEARTGRITIQSRWLDLVETNQQISDRLNVSKEDPADDEEESFDATRSLPTLASELKTEFRDFKIAYLGGQIRSTMKEIANPTAEQVQNYADRAKSFMQDNIVTVGKTSFGFVFRSVFGTVIMVISLYFFLLDGPKMLAAVKSLSPLDDRYESELVAEFDSVSRAVVLATLLSAIVQGILAGIGFYFIGLESVFLLMLLTTICALIPFFGAAAVWVPCSAWLILIDQRVFAGLLLAAYGAGIISMADNVIKPFILHGQSNIHPLFALLSVLGGVTTLGPIGILIGPMVVAFLQTLLKILQKEMKSMDAHREAAKEAAVPLAEM